VTPARSSCPALAKDINLGEIGMSADKGELLQSLRIGIFPSIRAARMPILAGLYGR